MHQERDEAVAKKVKACVKLQLQAGKATPAPPVGPALGQHGVAIMNFVQEITMTTSQSASQVIQSSSRSLNRSHLRPQDAASAGSLAPRGGIEKGSSTPNTTEPVSARPRCVDRRTEDERSQRQRLDAAIKPIEAPPGVWNSGSG
jgi:hypothetical protein